jgi:Mg-chelatase subunit ChlD
VLEPSGSGSGMVLVPVPGRRGAGAKQKTKGGAAPGVTDEEGELVTDWPTVEPDPRVRAAALAVAARLSLPTARRGEQPRRGPGRLNTQPFSGASSDIDLDATLERLVAGEVEAEEDVLVREQIRTRRSVVLAVDVSGSMRGERVEVAAGAVAGLASRLVRDDLAVIAFWSDAAVLLPLGKPIRPLKLVDALLRLPSAGLTNVALPLQLAAAQLRGSHGTQGRVILVSDCVHNAGPDPVAFARRLPRLDVLLDVSGDKDRELGTALARAGRGRLVPVRRATDVPGALRTVFRR